MRSIWKSLFIGVLTVALTNTAVTQRGGFPQSNITFEQIPSPDFGRVNAVIRDGRGFLWFGTSKGLYKYDGYSARAISTGSSLHDKKYLITSIMRLDDNNLLLGTGKGLWTLNLSTEQVSQFPIHPDLAEVHVNAIAQDGNNSVWIGTGSHGLVRYERTTGALRYYRELGTTKILCLLIDGQSTLWIGTIGGGLKRLDIATSNVVHYRSLAHAASLHSDNVTSLCLNGDQELWVGTSEGLNVLDLKGDQMARLELHSHTKHSIVSLARDPLGKMWVAALDLGVLVYDHGSSTLFESIHDVNRSLTGTRALYVDPVTSNTQKLLLWIGTRAGVNKVTIARNPFANHVRNQDSLFLHRGAVLNLCEDRKGILWVGLWGGGLDGLIRTGPTYRMFTNFKREESHLPSLPNNDVSAVIEDRSGNLWIGTSGGVAVIDEQRRRMVVYRHKDGDLTSLVNDRVDAFYEDRAGTMWICTAGGLSAIDHRTSRQFKNYIPNPPGADPLEGKHVADILEDHQSNFWIATYGCGLIKIKPDGTEEQFLHPGDSTNTNENWVYSVVQGNADLFWLSTNAGLISFDPTTGRFGTSILPQLKNTHIFGIVADTKGNLWLSTELGLAKVDLKTGLFTRFDQTHGIAFTEMRSAFSRTSRGTLLVGGLDGFVEFNPDSVSTTFDAPAIAITSCSVFGKEIPAPPSFLENTIRFPHDQNSLSFSFAVLDYESPRQNRFMYRMIGVDPDWVDAGTRNFATYASLVPGHYEFQVKGCNSNNAWSAATASVSIAITPPYWQTWWFRLFVVLLVAGAVYVAYRYRLRKLLEVERIRLRIANDLHDDIGSNLSTIAMISRTIQRTANVPADIRNKLNDVYETAVTTAAGMRDIVWFIKPHNDRLDDLLLRMKDTASSILASVTCELHTPPDGLSGKVSIDFKRNFFLAFKETLTNIARHASATHVCISITCNDGVLKAVVEDNGRGFDPSTVTHGNGLANIERRVHSIGGNCEIVSRENAGTVVSFSGRL